MKFVPYLGGHIFYQKYPISMLLKDNILYYSIFGTAGVASFFFRLNTYKIKLQAEKEYDLLNRELNYIKNQFNSHITFNFLNYCYSKIHRQLPEIAESIDVFSEILRYNLKVKADIKVPLAEEINHINNFITLQKKLDNKANIKFELTIDIKNELIVPHILIYFIENAFKFGIFIDSEYSIEIALAIKNDSLNLKVKNKVDNNVVMNEITSYHSIRQILNNHYPNNYSLHSEKCGNYYHVTLSIKL